MTCPERPETTPLLPDEGTVEARRAALVSELTPAAGRRRRRGRARPMVVALAATLLLGAGVAVAAGVFSADDVDLAAGVGCYSEPRLHGDDLIGAHFHTGADPVAKCAKLWREGVMGTEPGSAPPHLVACSSPGAGITVFPGPDDLCGRLGMEALPADFAATGREAGRAYTAWNRFLSPDLAEVPPGSCRSPEKLAAQARARLAKTEYRDVPIIVSGGMPCAQWLNPEGSAIAVLTTSRDEDRRDGVGDRAIDALAPLLATAADACIPPARFEAVARKVLRQAGLGEVEFRVEPRWRPCAGVAGNGFSPQSLTVSIPGESRRQWRGNALARRKVERAWRHNGLLPDSN